MFSDTNLYLLIVYYCTFRIIFIISHINIYSYVGTQRVSFGGIQILLLISYNINIIFYIYLYII